MTPPPTRRLAAGLALTLAVALLAGGLARPPAVVRFEAGGITGGVLRGWSESDRTSIDLEVAALDPSAAELGHQFRFRAARPRSAIDLPLVPRGGALRLTLRAMARVRTAVAFHVEGEPAAEITIPRGRWALYAVDLPSTGDGDGLEADLTLRALPMVRVPDEYVAEPRVWVADVEATAPQGLAFAPRARLLFAAAPLAVFAFAVLAGCGALTSAAAAAVLALVSLALARTAPVAVLVAIPRLLLVALAAGLLARLALGRARAVSPRTRAALAGLVAAGTLGHGALAFVPGYDPYDLEVHVRRARDLGDVPFEYGALLRYGSHLPTATQTFGTATAALGERTLIPYSPLPYVFFYALHRAGIDLHWGMSLLDTVLAMLVAPWLWVVAGRVWSGGAAWVATLLYALDLPVWHHLARAHVPASFGAALGTAALLLLVLEAERLDVRRRAALAAAALAVAALGYSSHVVLFGLFGLLLLALLLADARALSRAARRGTAAALVGGGLLAGALFYFHYVPGLLHGVGPLQAEPDLFRARTYFIFHNESRQSMRVWAAGFALPVVAGLLAAPFALRRAWPAGRPALAAWVGTWPLVMLAKEPFLFPRPLRWAKEDEFLSPVLALFLGAAAWALPRPWMRWTAAVVVVAVAAWLQAGDFRVHATGAMP